MSTLTIVPIDKIIAVDGVSVICDFDIDADIHAVQWDGTNGHVEYKSGKDNTFFNSIDDYQEYIDLHGVELQKQKEERESAEVTSALPEYQTNRLSEYGAIGDQLDMIYWDGKNGTNLWQEHIDVVKEKYPKE